MEDHRYDKFSLWQFVCKVRYSLVSVCVDSRDVELNIPAEAGDPGNPDIFGAGA